MSEWIPVSERLPEEKESMFEKWYGTDRWLPGMFRTVSDEVIVATVYNDGSSKVQAMRTLDGEWSGCRVFKNLKVTHWMPMPELPKEIPYV